MTEPEIVNESKERLEVLELTRAPRAEKMARENALLEGASEVHFTERAFRPRHAKTIDEIRAAVDQLPDPKRGAPLPEPRPLPPAPSAPAAAPRIRDEHRAALAPLLGDDVLVSVDVVYASEAGDVIEAKIEHHGKPHTGTFVIENGVARRMTDVHHAVDALPAPRVPPPSADTPTPPAPAEPEKKGRFALPKVGKKEKPAPPPAAPKEEPKTDAKPSKFKLPFGKKK